MVIYYIDIYRGNRSWLIKIETLRAWWLCSIPVWTRSAGIPHSITRVKAVEICWNLLRQHCPYPPAWFPGLRQYDSASGISCGVSLQGRLDSRFSTLCILCLYPWKGKESSSDDQLDLSLLRKRVSWSTCPLLLLKRFQQVGPSHRQQGIWPQEWSGLNIFTVKARCFSFKFVAILKQHFQRMKGTRNFSYWQLLSLKPSKQEINGTYQSFSFQLLTYHVYQQYMCLHLLGAVAGYTNWRLSSPRFPRFPRSPTSSGRSATRPWRPRKRRRQISCPPPGKVSTFGDGGFRPWGEHGWTKIADNGNHG